MAKPPIGELFVSLRASATQFDRDMQASRRSLRDNTRRMNRSLDKFQLKMSQSVKSVFSLRSALIAVGAATALGFFIKKQIEAADAIGKTADAIGISTDALQELRFAAELSGVSVESLDGALQAFSKRVGEARNGTGTLITILKNMDQELLRSVESAQSVDEAFDLITGAAADMGNSLDRNALLAAAFGRTAGIQMANLVKNGAGEIARLRQEARDLGLVISEDMIRNAEAANDELTKMFRVIQVQLTKAVVSLSPEIIKLGNAFTEIVPDIVEFLNGAFGVRSAEQIRERIKEVDEEIQGLIATSRANVGILDRLFGTESQLFSDDRLRDLQAEAIRLREELEKVETQNKILGAGFGETGEAASKTAEKIAEIKEELRAETAQLGRSEAEQKLYTLAKKAGVEVNEEFRASILPLINNLMFEERWHKSVAEAAKNAAADREELERRGQAVAAANRTAQERYNDTLEELNELLREGVISQRDYARAVNAAREELEQANEATKDAVEDTEKLIVVVKETGREGADAFTQWAIEGENLSDVLKSLEKDLLRLGQRKFIEPLFEGFLDDISGSSGGGGIFSTLASIGGSTFGGGQVVTPGSLPARAHGGPVTAGMPFEVGEYGRELFVPEVDGEIIPSRQYRDLTSADRTVSPVTNAPMTVVNNFKISTPTGEISRPAQTQVAAAASAGVRRGARRTL